MNRTKESINYYLKESHVPWNCQRRNYPLWAFAKWNFTPEAYEAAKPLLYNAEFAVNQYLSRMIAQSKL